MFSYCAFVWDAADPRACETARLLSERTRDPAQHWQTITNQNGLAVFCKGIQSGSSEAYVLDGNAGAVLGKLFCGKTAARRAFNERETAALIQTKGRDLFDRYWGRYVAFIHDRTSHTTWILRDPSVGMPCLTTHHRGVDVYFSRMEDALALGLGPFTINWPYLGAHLTAQMLEIHDAALNEVSRVLAGECIETRNGVNTRSTYWDPLQIAERGIIDNPAQAAAALRETTRNCVHAWASGHSNIVHTLSGGLDSSIVLACLKEAPSHPNITCVNYHSVGADTDERSYAQEVAQQAGLVLIERERDPNIRFESLLDAPRSAYPINCRYYLENSAWEAQFAQERQATALFCGEGGDQLFYQSRANFAAGDYLCRKGLLRGLRPELLRVALDSARLDRRSLWFVLHDAFDQAVLGRRWQIQSELGRFRKLLSEDLVAAVRADTRFIPPLLRNPGSVPSGKRWHAFQLMMPAMDFYDPLGLIRNAERVTPLWSQPLIELCLRIPTDILTTGGWDRAIARRAFQQDLPRKIILRRTKGGVDQYLRVNLFRNMPFLRDFLLNGALIRERLIDRHKLETVLSGNPSRVGGDATELFDFANSEAWVRNWERSALQRNADNL